MTTLRSRASSSRCRGFTDERSPRDVDARHVAHRRLERSAFVRCLSAIRVLQARATTATGLPFRNGSEHVVRACPRLAYPRGTAAALRYPCQRERRTRHEGTRATRCSPRAGRSAAPDSRRGKRAIDCRGSGAACSETGRFRDGSVRPPWWPGACRSRSRPRGLRRASCERCWGCETRHGRCWRLRQPRSRTPPSSPPSARSSVAPARPTRAGTRG